MTGKRGFVAINVARDRTKPRVGFMRRALSVFERYDVSVEHMPTGVDRFGAVVQERMCTIRCTRLWATFNRR